MPGTYIGTDSCHDESWLRSVPMSLFLRSRRNCSFRDDYLREGEFLKTCFLQKGYTAIDLDLVLADVDLRKREDLLKPKTKNENADFSSRLLFFTTYSNQHFFIKNIFRKHWDVLKNDRILGPLLPEKTRVTFKTPVPPE